MSNLPATGTGVRLGREIDRLQKGDVTRKRWDKEEFQKKAAARERIEETNDEERAGKRAKTEPEKPLVNLQARPDRISFDPLVGKTTVVQAGVGRNKQPGFYCKACDMVLKDNVAYLDHINGKKHQVNMGMNMQVQRATLEQVQARLALLKKQKDETPVEYDLEARVKATKEAEEKEKQERKERKKAEKEARLAQEESPNSDLEDMAAVMGFGGFSTAKK
jgi:U4/U6.U5 tri-snRNP component SNU23